MKLVIVNYGVGNLFSLESSFARLGVPALISSDPADVKSADKLILPGVGAFRDAAEKLRETGLVGILNEKVREGTPLLGICLGMQLLFETSYEYGEYPGLGYLEGSVRPIPLPAGSSLKIPHMGWNRLSLVRPDHPLFRGIRDGEYVYFVHSYEASDCDASLLAVTDYGGEVPAAVGRQNVLGCQFHPEKSGETGLKILSNFVSLNAGELC
ncbi:MAG: imidazole glycerol phosphate synthase subunit HisH [Clostridia bacterium]|nr:imidazole glycerol phosphate synthase subunit HisH [Clostridia bacterium]